MADYLIQQQAHIVNFIDNTGGANKLLFAAGRSSVAQPSSIREIEVLKVNDQTGVEIGNSISFTGNTVSTQLDGGAVTPFAGTFRELIDLINNSFFDDAVVTTGGVAPVVPSKVDAFSGSLIDLENDGGGSWVGFDIEVENIMVEGLDFTTSYDEDNVLVNDTLGLVNLINAGQQAFTFTVLSDTLIGVWGNERPVNDFIRLSITEASAGVLEYDKNLVTATTAPALEQVAQKSDEISSHIALFDAKAVQPNVQSIDATDLVANPIPLVKANKYRKELIYTNSTNKTLYIKYGLNVTATDRTLPGIEPEGMAVIDNYKGDVTAILNDNTGATGFIHITETV